MNKAKWHASDRHLAVLCRQAQYNVDLDRPKQRVVLAAEFESGLILPIKICQTTKEANDLVRDKQKEMIEHAICQFTNHSGKMVEWRLYEEHDGYLY